MQDPLIKSILSLMGSGGSHPSSEFSDDARSLPWVLHVDDDADFSRALKIRLEAHGVAVVRAFDGLDGVRSAKKYPADAIILDMVMPNGNGEEVLRLLKQNPLTREIPAIVLSSRRDGALRRRLLDLGAVEYLTKPLDFPLLHHTLSRYFDVLPLSRSREVTIC